MDWLIVLILIVLALGVVFIKPLVKLATLIFVLIQRSLQKKPQNSKDKDQ